MRDFTYEQVVISLAAAIEAMVNDMDRFVEENGNERFRDSLLFLSRELRVYALGTELRIKALRSRMSELDPDFLQEIDGHEEL